jgi:hypothetical protein
MLTEQVPEVMEIGAAIDIAGAELEGERTNRLALERLGCPGESRQLVTFNIIFMKSTYWMPRCSMKPSMVMILTRCGANWVSLKNVSRRG